MNLRRVMCSNLWPVATYVTMALWLGVLNHHMLGLDFGWTAAEWAALRQVDGIAHFSVALSFAVTFKSLLGKRATLVGLSIVMAAWEIFEVLTQPLFAGPSLKFDYVYLADTLDDIALGIAGMLVGLYAEPLNSATG